MEIVARTIAEAWEKSVEAIINQYNFTHQTVITERDTSSIEIENMIIVVTDPLEDIRISQKHPNVEYLNKYVANVLDFKYQKHVYSRLIDTEYDSAHVNQLDHAKELLNNLWYSTKGVITVWDPYIDLTSEHPPCTCLLQFYIRNNSLCLTSYFRSNDAWLCSHGDMLALTNLQKSIADQLDIDVGKYTHIACCYHIYEYDIQAALSKFDSL